MRQRDCSVYLVLKATYQERGLGCLIKNYNKRENILSNRKLIEGAINRICDFVFFLDFLFGKANIEGKYSNDRNNTSNI